nr:MAG TPA: hypothetical protein [Caudoviricetes sp.]
MAAKASEKLYFYPTIEFTICAHVAVVKPVPATAILQPRFTSVVAALNN